MRFLLNTIPSFEKRIWWILFGYTVSLFGMGMTEPFLIIYLHRVRDITLSLSGVVIAMISIAGVLAVPVSGWLGDHFGTSRTFIMMLVVNAIGEIAFALANHIECAFVAALVSGTGAAGSWNALSSILAGSVPASKRNEVFGVAFGLQNLGVGLGSAFGGAIIHHHSLSSFQIIFFLDAITFLLFALIGGKWASIFNMKQKEDGVGESPFDHTKGYRSVLKDKALLGIAFTYIMIAVMMSGLTTTAFPQWATEQVQTTTDIVGLAFFVNSLVIIAGQLLMIRLIRNKRRTRATAFTILFLGVGSMMIWISGYISCTLAVYGLIFALGVIGVGETMLFSSLPALVNDLALDALRNRYNAIFNLSWQAGAVIGPPLAGVALGANLKGFLFLLFIFITALLIPFTVWLERFIPIKINRGD
jgi:MFS family permease